MEDKTIVAVVALIVLAVVEVMALNCGIDGQLLMVVLVIIAGSVGVPLGIKVNEKVSL